MKRKENKIILIIIIILVLIDQIAKIVVATTEVSIISETRLGNRIRSRGNIRG